MMTHNGICCFTGHRDYESTATASERLVLEKLIVNLIRGGYHTFITGGAIGFDTAVAEYILKLRNEGAPIRLRLALPCADQTTFWGDAAKQRYLRIKEAADEVVCLQQNYTSSCMQARNRYMVNESSVCIAYCKQDKGGTVGTINYAKTKGVPHYNIVELARTLDKK